MPLFPPSPMHHRSPASQLARKLLLVLLFAVVAALFWITYEQGFDRLGSRPLLEDRTQTLTAGQLERLEGFGRLLSRRYGITLRLLVSDGNLELPRIDSSTLFVGLDLSAERAVVVLPPLLRRSLDPDLVRYLEREHFYNHLDPSWPMGLERALQLILDELATQTAS